MRVVHLDNIELPGHRDALDTSLELTPDEAVQLAQALIGTAELVRNR